MCSYRSNTHKDYSNNRTEYRVKTILIKQIQRKQLEAIWLVPVRLRGLHGANPVT